MVCSLQTALSSAGYAKAIPFMALLLPADNNACLSFHGRYGRDLFLKSQALSLK